MKNELPNNHFPEGHPKEGQFTKEPPAPPTPKPVQGNGSGPAPVKQPKPVASAPVGNNNNPPKGPKIGSVRQKIVNQGFGPSKEQRLSSFKKLDKGLYDKYGKSKNFMFDPYQEGDYDQPANAWAIHTDGKGPRRSNYISQRPDGLYTYSYRKGTHGGEEVIEDELDDEGVMRVFGDIDNGINEFNDERDKQLMEKHDLDVLPVGSEDMSEEEIVQNMKGDKIYTDSHGIKWKKNIDKDGKNYGYSRVDAPHIISNIPADTGAEPEEGWDAETSSESDEREKASKLFGTDLSNNIDKN